MHADPNPSAPIAAHFIGGSFAGTKWEQGFKAAWAVGGMASIVTAGEIKNHSLLLERFIDR